MNEQHIARDTIDIEQVVRDTCDLIRQPSENPGGNEAATVAQIRAIAERNGAHVHTHEALPGRENIIVSYGPNDGPAFLFLGHSDVVPAGEGWSQDPFEPLVADGRIIGRGATDMKGGVAAVLEAMRVIHGLDPKLRLEFLVTVDEEDRSQGVTAALAHLRAQPYVACIVAEPTNLDVVVGCRGATNFVVDITGASAHAGRPEDGVSAISAAARLIDVVRNAHEQFAAQEPDALIGGPTFNVGTVAGGSGTSMVPRQCTVTIDRRTMPDEHPEQILDDLLARVRADIAASSIHGRALLQIDGRVDMVMPGFRTSEHAPLPVSAQQALRALGHDAAITGWTAACEGGYIARDLQTPTIILGPGDINTQAHQPDEHVVIDHLAIAALAYVTTVLALANALPADHGVSAADSDDTSHGAA